MFSWIKRLFSLLCRPVPLIYRTEIFEFNGKRIDLDPRSRAAVDDFWKASDKAFDEMDRAFDELHRQQSGR